MKIAPLRDRVTFYQRKIVQDEIGNESSEWKVLFQGGVQLDCYLSQKQRMALLLEQIKSCD